MSSLGSKLHAPCHDRLWRFSLPPILLQILQLITCAKPNQAIVSTSDNGGRISKFATNQDEHRQIRNTGNNCTAMVGDFHQPARTGDSRTGSESAREGKPTFDHQRHPPKNERCAGVIPRVFAITVQQWPVIFIKHQPRETAQRTSESAREGKPTFDHQRHPQKNERCAGVIPPVFAYHCTAMAVYFYQASATGDSTRTTQQTRLGVYPKSNGVILQTATPMHFLNMSQFS